MRNILVFFLLHFFIFSALAGSVDASTGIVSSLNRIDQFFAKDACVRPALRASSSCPKTVIELVSDEGEWRSAMIFLRYHPDVKLCEANYETKTKSLNQSSSGIYFALQKE